MKKRLGISRILLFAGLSALLTFISVLPALGAPVAVLNIADTYTISCSIPVYYLNGQRVARVTSGTLTISDNTTTTRGVISNASVTITGYGTVALVGFVGAGTGPRLSLIGSDGETVVNINGYVRYWEGTIRYLSGRFDGWRWHGGGSLGDDPIGATAAWSTADSYNGGVSALLTQGANEGSTHVQVTPPTGITLSMIDTLVAGSGWSFWHKLQNTKAYGPQVELRFAAATNVNPDGAGHVDVTLLPHQEAGDGTWEQEVILGASTKAGYYGNDPWDGTAFDEFSGTLNLADVEAAINAEAAMLANGGFTCGAWVLTRVRVELWEAGARTCYVDDLSIAGTSYPFEPVQFDGTFRATP